jgi:hypothetical protein
LATEFAYMLHQASTILLTQQAGSATQKIPSRPLARHKTAGGSGKACIEQDLKTVHIQRARERESLLT